MKKLLLLLGVVVVMVLLFAPVALADHHTAMSTATSSATAGAGPTATATASALLKSGGPPLVVPITLAASLTFIASGVGTLALLRKRRPFENIRLPRGWVNLGWCVLLFG